MRRAVRSDAPASISVTSYLFMNVSWLQYAGMTGSMGQAGMGSYYSPAAAYGSISASMAAAAAAAAQQSAAMSGLAAPAQVSR